MDITTSRLIGLMMFLLSGLSCGVVTATDFDEGIEYQRISPPVPTSVGDGEVEVVELFWYGCPHCYHFEPYISKWLKDKPEGAKLVQIPATLNPGWVTHARTYYTLEILGEIERMHSLIFQALHEQGRRLKDLRSIARFVGQHGIDEQKFKDAYNSMEVQTKVRRAMQLSQGYKVDGVPAVIVNGKYRTSATLAGGNEKMLELINYLVKFEQEQNVAVKK